jgi:hypothetical protein
MAFEYARLLEITTLPSSTGSVFANPSTQKSYVRLIVLHNANTTEETAELWEVPDSTGSVGTAADTNKFYKGALAAGATVMLEFAAPGLILIDTNESIQGKATTASKVTIEISGAKE